METLNGMVTSCAANAERNIVRVRRFSGFQTMKIDVCAARNYFLLMKRTVVLVLDRFVLNV